MRAISKPATKPLFYPSEHASHFRGAVISSQKPACIAAGFDQLANPS